MFKDDDLVGEYSTHDRNLQDGELSKTAYWAVFDSRRKYGTDHILKKCSCPFLFATMDDNAPIHRARVVTEWFDEHENDENHMP